MGGLRGRWKMGLGVMDGHNRNYMSCINTGATCKKKTVGILNGVISESENCQNKIGGLLVAGVNLIKFKFKSNKPGPIHELDDSFRTYLFGYLVSLLYWTLLAVLLL